YQMTMKFDNAILKYKGVQSGVLNMDGSNVGEVMVQEGLITMSWHEGHGRSVSVASDKVLFTVSFEVLSDTRVSEAVSVNSILTRAEAYDEQISVMGLTMEFKDGERTVEVFDLYQNVPNPFESSTVIGYTLPREMPAILTIYDVSGKVLLVRDLEGKRGYNESRIRHSELNGSGVMYYQLDAEDYTSTRRMVLID
ncbi:MAG: cohesin domain-containing protein, partial [Saprospiraceae bacterium]|nr:cohesin domain-containing protein [Saprospiraceae bacterium]